MNAAVTELVPFTAQDDSVIVEEVKVSVATAHGLAVIDPATFARAGEIRVGLAALAKRIKAYFDPDVKRAHELHKSLTTKRKAALDTVEQEMARLDIELSRFKVAEDAKRRALELKASEEAQRQEQDRLTNEAALLHQQGQSELAEAVLAQAISAPAPAIALRSELPAVEGLSFVEPVWRYRVLNEALIPRTYLTPDLQKIGAVVKAMKGATRIPGVEVYEDLPGTRART